jgi:sporulation-control protein spo0M
MLLGDAEGLKEIYQKELKEIKLKTVEPYIKLKDDEHIKKFQLRVVFEVIKPVTVTGGQEQVSDSNFKNGSNEKYITLELDSNTKEWLILEIKNEP